MEEFSIFKLTKDYLVKNINDFINILKEIPNEYWSENNFILDLPGKWDYSICITNKSNKLIGYIIASEKNDCVHIHKFMVNENYRNKKIGKTLLDSLISICKSSKKNKVMNKESYLAT